MNDDTFSLTFLSRTFSFSFLLVQKGSQIQIFAVFAFIIPIYYTIADGFIKAFFSIVSIAYRAWRAASRSANKLTSVFNEAIR